MQSLISDSYRAEQTFLHTTHPKAHKYGTGGLPWAGVITDIASAHDCKTILDYGCGKGLLAQRVPGVRLYDPAIARFNTPPEPADLVTCLDVLEHIEPEFLDNVLDHLVALTRKCLFVTISLKTAGRTLRDGRNAHLIVEGAAWWHAKFEGRRCDVVREYPPRVTEWVALLKQKPAATAG